MQKPSKGFTLLELLIVIAILAILSAVTIIVLNPAELLRKSRDSQRLSDISTIKTGLGFYIINTSSPTLTSTTTAACADGASRTIYSHNTAMRAQTVPASASWLTTTTTAANSGNIDGTGWIPVNLSVLSGGSPLAKFPIDPSNSGPTAGADNDFYYTYTCHGGNLTFEIDANMESAFYKNGGTGDVESKDGGDWATIFEDGTALNLLASSASSSYYFGE